MDAQIDRLRYNGDYGNGEQKRYDNYDHPMNHRGYRDDEEGDIDERRNDRERTRDRERRRERRRREREQDRERDPRDIRDIRDLRDIRDPRDRHDDRSRDRDHRRREEESVYDYGHGEGFYEEGGYIDASMKDDYTRSDGDRMRDRDRFGGQGGNNWMTDTPTNTILLRNLPHNIDETDIKAELMMFGSPIKDVRLMKKKETGASRGFAFVEFQTVTDAQHWMDQNQGRLTLLNKYKCSMYYSMPKNPRPPDHSSVDPRADWQRTDWTCSKCGYHNFKRRDHCFKCNIGREDSAKVKEGDGFDQVGNNPCNTLIFRGLDALTTEENIIAALGKVAAHPVKNVKVIRDEATGTSRGFGFAEFSTLAESQQMLMVIQNNPTPFEVDGKAIIVSYAKNTFSTTMATMDQQNQWAQQATSGQYDYSTYYDAASGQYYDPTTGQYYDYAAYYAQQQQQQQPTTPTTAVSKTQTDSTNAAAAVAQAAIQQAQAAKHYHKQHLDAQKPADTTPQTQKPAEDSGASTDWSSQDSINYAKYPTPDVSTYQYDETSGYYFDPTTGLYYDANSQYYYNSTTGQFMYWDGEKETYLPAPNQDQVAPNVGSPPEGEKKDPKKDKEKKEKVKVAKKIAKDMEKWAKSLNARKEAFNDFKKSFGGGGPETKRESASADAGFAILEMVKSERQNPDSTVKKEEKQVMPPPSLPGGKSAAAQALVAAYGEDSDEDNNEEDDGNDEDKLLDYTKLACLLCKRQFPTKEALQRHQQLSDLHKSNMEAFRQSKADSSSTIYRDRAKERRAKFGKPSPPVPKKQASNSPAPFVPPVAPPPPGMDTANVGNKLLQKLGWSQGEGLGKTKQGTVNPVETTQRNAQAGLGSRGSALYTRLPGESYRDAAKKTMFARYQELE